jgi:hypothetical protein
VLAQVVTFEDDTSLIGAPLGGNATVCGVDAEDAPAVAVADLVAPITTLCAAFDGQSHVVVAA